MSFLLAPSILSADFGNLRRDCEMINESKADWFHIDVMDGVFVPNISFGMPVLKAIGSFAKKPLDVHLMIIKPERYIEKFANLGSEILTVHFEASPEIKNTINAIKSLGMKAGVAINPDTSVSVLEPFIREIDLVCLMSVNPGFSGQTFIEKTYEKMKNLKKIIHNAQTKTLIEVDGGVSSLNSHKLIKNGANILVAGNYIFSSKNPKETISEIKNFY